MRSIKLFSILFALPFFLSAQKQKFQQQWLHEPKKFASQLEGSFVMDTIDVFNPSSVKSGVTILENGYALSTIKNAGNWQVPHPLFRADTISFVYTQYPKDKNFWLTDYNLLLAERLKALFLLDSTLNSTSVFFKIILQTKCNSDKEARQMFHGITVHVSPVSVTDTIHRPTSPENIAPQINSTTVVRKADENIIESKKINSFINGNGGMQDSVVYNVFDRHPEWKKTLVVMDWTGSMYPYGGQAVLWHSLNFKKSGIKYFVFFNDGNTEKRKKIGRTRGIYFEKAENLKKIVNLLSKVKAKGNGGDTEENDLEAVLKGVQKYPDFENIVLIADNNSCIRDFCLVHELKVPLKIILCGTYAGINPQFLNLAYKTGGSIHTIEDDIYDIYNQTKSDATLLIDGNEYRFNTKRDLFEYTVKPDKDDPHYCEPFYKKKNCHCEKITN